MGKTRPVTTSADKLARTESATDGAVVEIGCDESGSEGETLINGNTLVFAHAGVALTIDDAAQCVSEVRDRIRSPATEYKANHLLRQKHRSVLEWLLGRSGPIHGRANVHLIDKTFFALGKAVDLLISAIPYEATFGLHQHADALAATTTLYREAQPRFGEAHWHALLEAANDLVRTKNLWDGEASVNAFFAAVNTVRSGTRDGDVKEVLDRLAGSRSRVDLFRERLLDPETIPPVLDPLISAVVHTVAHWSIGDRSVAVVHDYQSALTPGRIARMQELFDQPEPRYADYAPRGRLASLVLVDSVSDPRVQVADFLAGVARKIAEEELAGRGDPELTRLLRPYVDIASVWADERSWAKLGRESVPVEH